ncbi:MAG TPA: DinB family protein [Vicinamibacterales bacterium]|nr:DinB family protein [Vicinamibacterales bacterium]
MNKQELLARRDYFNLVHGVTVRAIAAFGDDELDFRPKAGMRTPRELMFHVYTQERTLAEAVRQGEFTLEMANRSNPEDPSAAAALGALLTVSDLRAYAHACHDDAERHFRSMSEEEVARPIGSPFGTFPAWQYFLFAYDEHWHHRGQLYSYLRLLGKEPPMLYDYQAAQS